MALTHNEEARLLAAEKQILINTRLLKGAGSKNQLNRLLMLGQKTNEELEETIALLEAEMSELLELARKLQ